MDHIVFYILDEEHRPVPCTDIMVWGPWFQNFENRRVARTRIGDSEISTVFLGMDHGFRQHLWFETMVFGGTLDGEQDCYETWEQAEQGHEAMVRRVEMKRGECPPQEER
jgi:hypothetical protein